MIANAILYLVHGLIIFIAYLLSNIGNVTPNQNIISAVTTANGYIAALNDFIPNPQILAATAVLFVFELIYASYKVIRWAYQKIPAIS